MSEDDKIIDLASARARLLAATDGLVAAGIDGPEGRSGSVVHLDRPHHRLRDVLRLVERHHGLRAGDH